MSDSELVHTPLVEPASDLVNTPITASADDLVVTPLLGPTFTLTSILSNNADTARGKSGNVVTAIFVASETLAANPTVTFGGKAMTYSSKTTLTYTYTRTLDGTETAGTNAKLIITATDANGNLTPSADLGSGSFTTDFTVPTMASAVRTNNTTLEVSLSELGLASTITKSNDGGFTVEQNGTPGTTYTVSAIAPGATNDKVVLTVASVAASNAAGLKVKYAASGNGTVADRAGNALATNATGVVIAAW